MAQKSKQYSINNNTSSNKVQEISRNRKETTEQQPTVPAGADDHGKNEEITVDNEEFVDVMMECSMKY